VVRIRTNFRRREKGKRGMSNVQVLFNLISFLKTTKFIILFRETAMYLFNISKQKFPEVKPAMSLWYLTILFTKYLRMLAIKWVLFH
jgi:hypothetical protein